MFPNGARFWSKDKDGLWWLGRISARTAADGEYLVRSLDDLGPTKVSLSPAHYTTWAEGVQGSCCVQLRRR